MSARPAGTAGAVSRSGKSIALRGVSKFWGETIAVDQVDITVAAGEFTVLLGPSGCGKSTTLRVIAGLESADAGQVLIGDRDVTDRPSAERDIAMVFQSYALFPHLSVAENIVFGLKVRRIARAEREERLARVADLLGLSGLLDRKPSQLSGGQQQRVALGRAIIAEKPVCLMDEPLSNLDAKLRHEMRVEIRALQEKLGFTMVYVTHDQVEAITMADQVVLMNQGRVEQAGPPRDIYDRPASPFAARFIGTPPMNLLSPDAFAAAAAPAAMAGLHAELSAAGCLVGIRPEALWPQADGPLRARIAAVEYLGADALVTCRPGPGDEAMIVRVPGGAPFTPGDIIALGFGAGSVHVFGGAKGGRRDDLARALELSLTTQELHPDRDAKTGGA